MQNKIKKIIVKDGVTALFDEQQYPTGKCAVLLCNKDRFFVSLIEASAHLSREYFDLHIDEIKTALSKS